VIDVFMLMSSCLERLTPRFVVDLEIVLEVKNTNYLPILGLSPNNGI